MYVRGYLQGSENGRVATIGVDFRLSSITDKTLTDFTMYVNNTATVL
jgi:hypothetical protein